MVLRAVSGKDWGQPDWRNLVDGKQVRKNGKIAGSKYGHFFNIFCYKENQRHGTITGSDRGLSEGFRS